MLSDADLATAARDGDPEAFAAIVERYQDRIVRHVYRMIGDWELSLDLAQDTFVTAYESLSRRRADASLAGWLFRIATNKAIDRLRRRRLLRWFRLDAVREHGGGDPAENYPEQAAVRRTLASLRPEDAACILLSVHEGLSHAELAAAMGVSPEAARKRVVRAKEAFRRAYRQEVGG